MSLRTAFVSYGHADAPEFARRLRDDLTAAGCRVWLGIDEITQGATWDVRIEAGVRSSDVLLAVMTSHSTREGRSIRRIHHRGVLRFRFLSPFEGV